MGRMPEESSRDAARATGDLSGPLDHVLQREGIARPGRYRVYQLMATGGICSVLFEYNPRNGALQATSGYGLDELRTDAWLPAAAEALLVQAAGQPAPDTLPMQENRAASGRICRLVQG